MKYVERTPNGTLYRFPVSGKEWLRPYGHVLMEERFTLPVIAGYKKNPRVWSGQYQQRPSPAGGYIFESERWKFYKERPELEVQVMSVDASFKDKKDSDLVAIHVYGVDGGNRFLFDRRTEVLDEPHTEEAILAMREKWPKISYILIEDKANGPAIISRLRSIVPGIIAINPEGGKESRAHAAAADLYSGNCYLPHPDIYEWVQPFIDHFASYNGEGSVEHDDDEDAFSQFINWARQLFSGVGTWLDQQYAMTQKATAGNQPTELCPACSKPVSYMSGVWVCTHCNGQTHGRDRGSAKIVTRVGF